MEWFCCFATRKFYTLVANASIGNSNNELSDYKSNLSSVDDPLNYCTANSNKSLKMELTR